MKLFKKYKNRQHAFTLLEVVFALAVLCIGLLGVLSLFPVGLRASKRAGDFTMVTILAQSQMEMIKTVGFSAYSVDGWYNWDTLNAQASPPNPSPFPDNPNFSWVAQVEPTNPPVANLKKITLSIYYLDRTQRKKEDFITYLANYE